MSKRAVRSFFALVATGALVPLVIMAARPGGPRSCGRTVLRVANWQGPSVDPAFLKLERDILDEFEAANPDIEVVMENIQQPGYGQKLLMSYVAGNPPDVISLDASSSAVFVNNGLLTDLAEPAKRDGSSSDSFFPNALDIARRGERIYAIPFDFTPMVILYNKRMFREAGVEFPKAGWTRDEFLEKARQLTKLRDGKPIQYGFVFTREMPMWFGWIWANGGDVLSADGRHAVGYLDGPACVDAIRFLRDLVKVHKAAPSLSQAAAVGRDLFRDPVIDGRHIGRAAMTMTGHWALIECRLDKMDIGVASIPSNAGRHVTVIYENGLAISKASRNKEAAWRYIRYMTSEAVQKRRLASGLAISGNVKAARSFAGSEVEDAFLAEAEAGGAPWGSRCEMYEMVEDLGREMMEDILDGDVSVEQAAGRMARLVEKELAKQ